MPASQSEIRSQVTSNDVDVLRQSLEFVKGYLAQENERGRVAEVRATVMLAVLGVFAGLIIPRAEVFTKKTGDESWFLLVAFIASLFFLVKGIFYAIRVLGISKRYRSRPDSIYDFQTLSPADALREEIVAVIWEHEHATSPTTEKLFWLNRCQRNSVLAIFLFVLFGLAFIVAHKQWFGIPVCATLVLGAIVGSVFLVGDILAERFGLWGGK